MDVTTFDYTSVIGAAIIFAALGGAIALHFTLNRKR